MSHALSNLAAPSLCPLKAVRVGLEIHHCLIHAFLRAENKRTILHDFLVKRLASNENYIIMTC